MATSTIRRSEGKINVMVCGGSVAASPAGSSGEGGSREWWRISDRVEVILNWTVCRSGRPKIVVGDLSDFIVLIDVLITWTTDPWELTVADLTQSWVPSTHARLQECL
jgi:hypothetical protein